MSSEPHATRTPETPLDRGFVEMPRPTAAPMVLSLGLTLMVAGVVTSPAFLVVGGVILVAGLGLWISHLLPGRGHVHEPFVEPSRRPKPVAGEPGTVAPLQTGMPGYRMRLPERVHPISAGIKGGIVGGLVMPIPAIAWGLLSGHGVWYPVNLLAGMVLPGVGESTVAELEQFRPMLLVLGLVIHAVSSVILGLIYGVLLPTLHPFPRPLAWGGLLMPLLWSGVSYGLMGFVNPALRKGVDWPWFLFSQFVFGVVVALVVMRLGKLHPIASGLLGGIMGGLLMPIPAVAWGVLTRRGVWYPINLLAGMVVPRIADLPQAELTRFHADWLIRATAIHAVLSVGFGLVYGVLLPRLRPIPGPLAWGGLLMPLLWTGLSYGLMGVVNPVLQERVDWFWFIVSQFVFGMAAAIVVLGSEKIWIPPAGRGPDRVENFVAGSGEGRP